MRVDNPSLNDTKEGGLSYRSWKRVPHRNGPREKVENIYESVEVEICLSFMKCLDLVLPAVKVKIFLGTDINQVVDNLIQKSVVIWLSVTRVTPIAETQA